MDKLKMHSPDLTERNIERIAELFPSVITESRDGNGRLVRAVDFDLLRQELSDHVVDGPRERYGLNWPGKREALFTANAPIAKTLRPVREESVNFDTTQNLFIEGDNLDALKLLQESYLGKVKLIYIDPPYNTGNDFIYNDDFSESTAEFLEKSGQVDDDGNRLVANTESNGRFHSDWLSMMYPRLKLARNLLSDDGVLLVSIDGNEQAQLRHILTQVFGPKNYVASIVWASNLKGRQLSGGGPVGTHEYILCAGRNAEKIEQFRSSGAALRSMMPTIYSGKGYAVKHDARGPYVTKNQLYNTNSKFNEVTAPTMVFAIHWHPETGDVQVGEADGPPPAEGYVTARPHPNARADVKWHAWRWSRAKVMADKEDLEFELRDGHLRIWTKVRDVDGMAIKDLVVGPSTATAQADLEKLGLHRFFETPKPVALLELLISAIATAPGDIVMDFFAGSASTAEAVLRANCEDRRGRRFIMCQVADPTETREIPGLGRVSIAQLGMERIRRATSSLGQEGAFDCGFRALRIDTSGMTATALAAASQTQETLLDAINSIKPDRTAEDLVFQVLLDWGLELSVPIVREELAAHEVFDVDNGALLACFDETVSLETVEAIARREPLRAVFRASAFATDADRINAEQLFAQYSPTTDVKAI